MRLPAAVLAATALLVLAARLSLDPVLLAETLNPQAVGKVPVTLRINCTAQPPRLLPAQTSPPQQLQPAEPAACYSRNPLTCVYLVDKGLYVVEGAKCPLLVLNITAPRTVDVTCTRWGYYYESDLFKR
ncbi:MAG: hypothetical protein QW498_08420 [Thermofilum sp.]